MQILPAFLAALFLAPALLAREVILTRPDGAAATPPAAAALDAGERVELTTDDKLSLVGSLYLPKAGKGLAPGALLVHDAGARRGTLCELAGRLQRAGFAVLVIDLRGHGQSATETMDWTKLSSEERERLWAFAVRDLKAASAFLRARENVHTSSLLLVGHRAGAALAARAALSDQNVRALALVEPLPQAEQLGFNLAKDLESLGGLPTFIAVSRDEEESGKRMLEAGVRGGSTEAVSLAVCRAPAGGVLADKKLLGDLGKWSVDKAGLARAGR